MTSEGGQQKKGTQSEGGCEKVTKLREALYQQGLAVSDVARGLGIDRSVLSSAANRKKALPKRHRLAVAGLFGVPEGALFDEFGLARVASVGDA